MLDSYKQKELERINKLVADYQKDIDALAEDAKGIDEKYRLMAEQEKAEITSTVDYLLALMDECKSKLMILSGEAQLPEKKVRKKKVEPVQEEKVEEKVEPQPAAEPEKVVDTLFPENNEPEPVDDLPADEPQTTGDELPWDEPADEHKDEIVEAFEETSWEMPKEWE